MQELYGKEAFIFPYAEERKEGALVIQLCNAMPNAVGAVQEPPHVLPLVCTERIVLSPGAELTPESCVFPPVIPSSGAKPWLLIFYHLPS